jgi:hypothetical protein
MTTIVLEKLQLWRVALKGQYGTKNGEQQVQERTESAESSLF